MKNLNKIKGVSIIAAIAIMLICSILGVVMAQLLGVTSRGSVDYMRSSQAFAAAQAGLNWQMMQLASTANWNSVAGQTVSLGGWIFTTSLSNWAQPQSDSTTSTRVDISVIGKTSSADAATIQRTMEQQAWKLPSATKFALFWGRDTGAWLELRSNTVVNGDIWSRGTMTVQTGSSVLNGVVYRPDTRDVNGGGTYIEQAIIPPYPAMPAINSSYYTGLINTYNSLIDANSSSTDIDQATDLVLTGNTINCRDFSTDGNITISGHGFIVANRNMQLHSENNNDGTLAISPSGGNIVFLAARNLEVNSGQSDTTVTGSSGIRMYSRSETNANQLLTIRNNTTNIDGALILANRRISVQNSANLTDSTFFVNYPGDDSNNYLRVTDSGTTVGTASNPCSLISISPRDPGLIINDNAAVTGLVYHKDAANNGYTQISTATITGSVIASQYTNDRIVTSTITYDPSAIPDPPPEGFDGFVTKKPNSWEGN